jgi:hypothetical protein
MRWQYASRVVSPATTNNAGNATPRRNMAWHGHVQISVTRKRMFNGRIELLGQKV